MAVMQTHAH